jgi:hypothetical protein
VRPDSGSRVTATLLAKRLTDHRPVNQDAADWSAALNAALMLPAGALLSLVCHPLLARVAAPQASDVLVSWQQSTPSSAASHYVLGIVLCFLLATWAAMRRPFPVPRAGFAAATALLLVFFTLVLAGISLLCQIVIYQSGPAWPAWLGLIAYAGFLAWYRRGLAPAATATPQAGAFFTANWSSPRRLPVSGYLADIAAVAAIFAIFWPYSIDALLAPWDIRNPHIVSYLVGPAQLLQVPGNLPNVDFFSQYSLGVPYVFSRLLSTDLAQVVSRYLYGMTGAVILYSAAYYFLLSRLYGNRFWGFVFTLLMMVLLANALFWSEPSSAPLRFLFFPICGIVLLRYGLGSPASIVAAGALAALSVMGNTETGIHTMLAFASVLFISAPSWRQLLRDLGLLAAVSIAGVLALCVLCYGPQALSAAFVIGNLKPLFVYSVVGFGNYPLPWAAQHWTWMQCLVLPGLATFLLALLYYKTWSNRPASRAEQALVFCSAFGLLLLMKFMYRSFMAIGHVNSGPLLAVLGFWLLFGLRKAIASQQWRPALAHVAAFAVAATAFSTFLYTFRENVPGRDIRYATTWLDYPSLLNRLIGMVSGPSTAASFAARTAAAVDDADVALIERYAQPASRPVWIYGDEDWAYLLRAGRKPAATVLPIPNVLIGRDLDVLKAKFERDGAEYVFVEKKHESLINSDHPAAVFPRFAARYARVDSAKNLAVYKKKAD